MAQPPGPYGPHGAPEPDDASVAPTGITDGAVGLDKISGGGPSATGSGPGMPRQDSGPGLPPPGSGPGAPPAPSSWQPAPPSPSLPGVPPPPAAAAAQGGHPVGAASSQPGAYAYGSAPPQQASAFGGAPPQGPAFGNTPSPQAPGQSRSADPARGRLIALTAVSLALALVASGALVWALAFRDGDGGGGTTIATSGNPMKQAWTTQKSGTRVAMLGAWTSGRRTFTGDAAAIYAYDIENGTEVGKFAVPSGEFCGMATTASSGVGIAMYGTEDDCDTVVALDLATMGKLWEKKGKNLADSSDKYRSVEIGVDGEIVVMSTAEGLAAYDLKTGDERWQWRSPVASGKEPEEVDGVRIDGGTVLVEQSPLRDNEPALVTAIDAADGSQKWKYPVAAPADTYASVWLVNASPAVIEVERDGEYVLQTLDDRGNRRAEIPLRGGPEGALRLDSSYNPPYTSDFGGEWHYSIAVAKDTLYLTSTSREREFGEIVRLVAFDLGTGKARWSKPLGTDVARGKVVGSDGTGVLVLAYGLPGAPGKLAAFKHEDGSSLGAREVVGKDLLATENTDVWMLIEGRLVGFAWSTRSDTPALLSLA